MYYRVIPGPGTQEKIPRQHLLLQSNQFPFTFAAL